MGNNLINNETHQQRILQLRFLLDKPISYLEDRSPEMDIELMLNYAVKLLPVYWTTFNKDLADRIRSRAYGGGFSSYGIVSRSLSFRSIFSELVKKDYLRRCDSTRKDLDPNKADEMYGYYKLAGSALWYTSYYYLNSEELIEVIKIGFLILELPNGLTDLERNGLKF